VGAARAGADRNGRRDRRWDRLVLDPVPPVNRPAVAIALAVLWMAGLLAFQWFVTSPGRTTDAEWHVMLLSSVPAFTIVLSAHWIDAGRRR
jgi:hypothetical protein